MYTNKEMENSSRSSFVLKLYKKTHTRTNPNIRDTNKQTAKSELTKRAVCRNEINGTVLESKIDPPLKQHLAQLICVFLKYRVTKC